MTFLQGLPALEKLSLYNVRLPIKTPRKRVEEDIYLASDIKAKAPRRYSWNSYNQLGIGIHPMIDFVAEVVVVYEYCRSEIKVTTTMV